MVKNPPANAEDTSSVPGLGRSLGKGNGNHSSIHTWEILWPEDPGGLHPWGHKIVRHDLVTKQQHS